METEETKRNQNGLASSRALAQQNIRSKTLKHARTKSIDSSSNGLIWDDISDVNVATLTEARVKRFSKLKKIEEMVKKQTQIRKP